MVTVHMLTILYKYMYRHLCIHIYGKHGAAIPGK